MTERGTERAFMTIAIVAAVALAAIDAGWVLGYLHDHILFLTLNISLPVFILTMTYQIYLRRRQNRSMR